MDETQPIKASTLVLRLAAEVVALEEERSWLYSFAGQMLSTLVVTQNRERIRNGDPQAIESLISLSDHWSAMFDARFPRNKMIKEL